MKNEIKIGICMLSIIVVVGCSTLKEEHKRSTDMEYLATLSCEEIEGTMFGCCGARHYTGCESCDTFKEVFLEQNCALTFEGEENMFIFQKDYRYLLDTACKLRGYDGSTYCEQCTVKNYPMCCVSGDNDYCIGYKEAIEMGQGNERSGGGTGKAIE